jgi:hypothetical protein
MRGRRIVSTSLKVGLAGWLLVLSGCGVQRDLVFRSNPSNALVYLNGEEIGRTPLDHEFLWYGKYDVMLRKEGYVSAKTTTNVKPPWWQWIGFDFVAELMPIRLRDKQIFTYTLLPASTQPADSQLMLENAEEYRGKLEGVGSTQPSIGQKKKSKTSKKATRKRPTTQRHSRRAATKPTTRP